MTRPFASVALGWFRVERAGPLRRGLARGGGVEARVSSGREDHLAGMGIPGYRAVIPTLVVLVIVAAALMLVVRRKCRQRGIPTPEERADWTRLSVIANESPT